MHVLSGHAQVVIPSRQTRGEVQHMLRLASQQVSDGLQHASPHCVLGAGQSTQTLSSHAWPASQQAESWPQRGAPDSHLVMQAPPTHSSSSAQQVSTQPVWPAGHLIVHLPATHSWS
jgi:hypothetical protein